MSSGDKPSGGSKPAGVLPAQAQIMCDENGNDELDMGLLRA